MAQTNFDYPKNFKVHSENHLCALCLYNFDLLISQTIIGIPN